MGAEYPDSVYKQRYHAKVIWIQSRLSHFGQRFCKRKENVGALVINPGAFGHTSVALRDAFLGTELPFVEVHISNVFAREDFRRQSLLSDIAIGVISGFGEQSYELGLRAVSSYLRKKNPL